MSKNKDKFDFILMDGTYYLGIEVPKKYYELLNEINTGVVSVIEEFYDEMNTAKALRGLSPDIKISKDNIISLMEKGIL